MNLLLIKTIVFLYYLMTIMIVGTILFNNYLNYLYILHDSSEYEGLVGTRLSDEKYI